MVIRVSSSDFPEAYKQGCMDIVIKQVTKFRVNSQFITKEYWAVGQFM